MSQGALSKIKVVDITNGVSGPYSTKLLASMGAEVIKIEHPDGGDPTRRLGPFPDDIPDPEKSGLFLYLNTSKKGVTLNFESEKGKNILLQLIKDADILVENFKPGTMASLGLDYHSLEIQNPKLVMTSISNFGQTGPYRDYNAQDINIDALGGLMYITGDPDREPLMEAFGTVQHTAGANACAASLAAYYGQKRTGIGQHVDVSLMEAAASLLDVHPIGWNRSRLVQKRGGPFNSARNWPGGAADNGVYPCKDGYVGVVFSYAHEINVAAQLFNNEEFSDPSIGYLNFGKCIEDERLNNLLIKALKNRDKEEVYRSAQKLRLFWGAVRNIKEVRHNDHYRERGFWIDVDHPKAGTLTYAKHPFIMSKTPLVIDRAPLFGEHNEEIYHERLGYSKADILKLRQMAVI